MTDTPDGQIAARILHLAGGPGNVRDHDMCFTRLRIVLVDPSAVDEAGIEAIPEVVMTFTQAGQFQVVLGGRVRGVYAAFRAMVDAAAS